MLQDQALNIMQMGHNVFLTGQAGSGKTYTLNKFIHWAREHRIGTAITASTGIAATHIGGTTIHSWCGIGIRDHLTEHDLEKLAAKKDLQKRFNQTKILIIDEVSMLSSTFFDNLNRICKYLKENELPFGGLQVILCGDLFQLPPINRSGRALQMVVHSEAWKESKPAICYLKEQHRQNDSDDLITILNNIRAGEAKQVDIKRLNERILSDVPSEIKGILAPTKLYSHNADVDLINEVELSKLKTRQKTYLTAKEGKRVLIESLLKSCLAPEELNLKIGAEVMFIKNDQSGRYANGTRGKVINFSKDGGWPIVQTLDERIVVVEQDSWSVQDEKGKVLASIEQIPLRLAWAITIHKSQGMSLDAAFINLGKVFEYGMGYVALSRVRSIDGLYLEEFNEMSLKVHPSIIKISDQLSKHSDLTAKRLVELKPKEITKKIEASIAKLGGQLKAEQFEPTKILGSKDQTGQKGKVGSHKTTAELLITGKTFEEVVKERDIKLQTVISHLARYVDEAEDPEAERGKFKKFKPPAKQIKELAKVVKKNQETIESSNPRYLLKELQKKAKQAGLNLTYEQLALTLIWL
jgi:ATP-dependent DNA helicase PIF1